MDLTGACNSEYVAGHQFTSTGGQLDFVRGAYASKGGLSFIAFQSSIKDGKTSKIVSRLSGPVTTPRTDVHYVVTENGVANLKGLSSTERAHALIGLADPTFQDELTAAAKESHLIWGSEYLSLGIRAAVAIATSGPGLFELVHADSFHWAIRPAQHEDECDVCLSRLWRSLDVKPMHLAASLLCVLFCFYEFAARFAIGDIQGLLGTAWGEHHIGSMISSYYIAYALTALAVGLPLCRYGASRVLPYATSMLVAGLSTAFADRWVACWEPTVFRIAPYGIVPDCGLLE
jgi:hypothetical protein